MPNATGQAYRSRNRLFEYGYICVTFVANAISGERTMRQYLDLMQTVLDHGVRKEDRTGVGTLSIFGYQNRYDLAQGFPLPAL